MSDRFRHIILYSKFTDNVVGYTYGGRVLPLVAALSTRQVITHSLYTFYLLFEVH